MGTGLAPLASAKAVDPETTRCPSGHDTWTISHFPEVAVPPAPTKPISRKPKRLWVRRLGKPFASLSVALGGRPDPPLPETPLRHRDDPFPRRCPSSQGGRPPSPRSLLPHPRPPRHRLLHALVHRPQRTSDSQLSRHAASSPHPPGNDAEPQAPGSPWHTPSSGSAQLAPCKPIIAHHRVVSPNQHPCSVAARPQAAAILRRSLPNLEMGAWGPRFCVPDSKGRSPCALLFPAPQPLPSPHLQGTFVRQKRILYSGGPVPFQNALPGLPVPGFLGARTPGLEATGAGARAFLCQMMLARNP